MGKFSRRPSSEAEFVAGADVVPPTAGLGSTGFDPKGVNALIGTVTATLQHPPVCPGGQPRPWEAHDPEQRARNVFNLRLNDHDMAILRHLAGLNEDLSMQKVAKRILVPELRRRVGL